MALLGFTLVLFLSALIAALVLGVRALRKLGAADPQPRLAAVARWMVVGVAALSWFFLFATGYATNQLMSSLGANLGVLQFMKLLVFVPPVIALLSAASLVLLVPVWQRRYWRLSTRVYHTALIAAALGFTWFLYNWKLLVGG